MQSGVAMHGISNNSLEMLISQYYVRNEPLVHFLPPVHLWEYCSVTTLSLRFLASTQRYFRRGACYTMCVCQPLPPFANSRHAVLFHVEEDDDPSGTLYVCKLNKTRFRDLRLKEVRRMLRSDRAPIVRIPDEDKKKEEDLPMARQSRLLTLLIRSYSMPIGASQV